MAVCFVLNDAVEEIGTPSFLHAVFSTMSGNLEPQGWGSRFPILMNELYNGALNQDKANTALAELQVVKSELKKCNPEKVIWDIEDRELRPPWGNNISPDITDLSNYFVTSGGEDFIEILNKLLHDLATNGGELKIE